MMPSTRILEMIQIKNSYSLLDIIPLQESFWRHFGAFLDQNFREYDYYVGVYDAIYHLAESLKQRSQYKHFSQIELMNVLENKCWD